MVSGFSRPNILANDISFFRILVSRNYCSKCSDRAKDRCTKKYDWDLSELKFEDAEIISKIYKKKEAGIALTIGRIGTDGGTVCGQISRALGGIQKSDGAHGILCR